MAAFDDIFKNLLTVHDNHFQYEYISENFRPTVLKF